MKEFSVFRKFPDRSHAKEIESLLNKNNINTILADNIAPVDLTFSGNTINDLYEIRIATADFERAEFILENDATELMNSLDKNHYLYDFTDDELYEVLSNSDEWSSLDYKIAQKILRDKGKNIDDEYLSKLKRDRLEFLAKPEENQKTWIIAGYIFAFLGGLLGILIGYVLFSFKKTLPNGQKVFAYNQNDRKHGLRIFWIGIIICPIMILLKAFIN